MSSSSTTDLTALQATLAGELLLPGSPRYESARKPAIARFHDIRPRAIVLCRHAGDVAETLAFARRSGLPVAPRSGGHCFAGRSSTEGIVIDLTPLRAVSVSGGLASVGAGTRLGDLDDRLHEHDVTVPAGCGATVGIAGLTLGGGLGILGRRHGLTCDQLFSAQVVLADGDVVDCDEHHHQELFWALRGAGGGHFGVVTSLLFRTVPSPTATTFHLTWPDTHADTLISAWQEWAPAAPDELDASLRVTIASDVDRPPEVSVFGAMLAGEAETRETLGQLITLTRLEPTSASHAQLPYREIKQSLAGLDAAEQPESEQPAQVYSKTEFFRRPLPGKAIAALLAHARAKRRAGQSRQLTFTPMGGAYNRVPADATAFVHRHERFLLEHVLELDAETATATRHAARAWVARSWAYVHPWGSGRVYPNFPDPDLVAWTEAYYGSNYNRLLRVKHTYDPHNLFRFPQSL